MIESELAVVADPLTVLVTLGSTLLVALAFLLLVGGVVGSIVPVAPGALLSVGGVLLYWWATGEPGPLLLAVLLLVGVGTVVFDWVGGIVAARASGTTTTVSVVAGVVGVAASLVAGPLGLVLGIAGSVFVVTYARERSAKRSLRRAVLTTAGVFATALIQALLTASILVAVAVVHLL